MTMPKIMPARRGRPPKSTQAELNEINRAKADAEQAIVLNQPHRKGERSHMAESPIGRFILQFALERELYDAALEYARIRGMWLRIMGAILPEQHDGKGGDVSEELAHRWRDDVAEWRGAMMEAGGREGVSSVEMMACDHIDLSELPFDRQAAQVSLRALGRSMGRL